MSYTNRKISNAVKREVNGMTQELKDLWLEYRISRLSNKLTAAIKARHHKKAEVIWSEYVEAICSRSEAQVQRMDKKMGVEHG